MKKALALSLGLTFMSLVVNSISRASVPTQAVLDKEAPQRMMTLKAKGPEVYRDLRKIAFNPEAQYQTRWRALMSMAWMAGPESIEDLELALQQKDWFMKDAAVRALVKVDSNLAQKHARKLLSDRALVVRTTAVDVIRELKDQESVSRLWEELYKKANYRGKQSLWVRRHIVEALSELSPKGNELRFVRILDDKDDSLHEPAMRGLERLTGQKPGGAPRGFWKKWAKNSSTAVTN